MTIGEALSSAYNILKSENIDTYMLDSQLLMQKVLKKDKLFIILNRSMEISKEIKDEYFKLIQLRKDKMPVKYILGECEFMGLNFNIKQGVLIPRADTEILVEEVIKKIKDNGYTKICDVCCGSGAIGVSIGEHIKEVTVDCYDISDIAIEVTSENINKFDLSSRVSVFKSDLLYEAKVKNKMFDVIVSNPPYIKENVIPTLMRDVREYEPYIALSGGEDGLYFYNKIVRESKDMLRTGGVLAFEIGYDQGEDVRNILIENEFINVRIIKDLKGLDRVVVGRFKQ